MKTVLMTLDAANKQGIAGSEKLTKTDLLVLVYVKGKKNIFMLAYLAGFHSAKNHDVFVVTHDKDKISAIVSKNAKVYTGFRKA